VNGIEKGGKGQKGNRKRKWKEERVKMGQGGTLDPLADGVLGKLGDRIPREYRH
jgi:tRNA U55 pseudouridine synthase TruB